MTTIVYPSEKYFKSFHEALSIVANERVYIEIIEAPPIEKVSAFQSQLIAKNGPVYYAINNDRAVGWCDVFPEENVRIIAAAWAWALFLNLEVVV